MKEDLINFLKFNLSKRQLQDKIGEDLYNIDIDNPVEISANDLIEAITKYLDSEITKEDLVNWVNVVWFTDLFEYKNKEAGTIASVMDVLETLDEKGVLVSSDEFHEMINSLKHNKIYEKENYSGKTRILK